MALLRTIPCSTQLSTKQHFDFENNNKKHSSTNPFFSSSSFHSHLRLSISHTSTTTLIRTKQHSNSTLRFTSTSEQQIQVTTEEQQQQDTEKEQKQEQEQEEEVSPTRLLAQNFPWTSTAEDVRTLFGKYGKVVDVELSMYNKYRNRGLAFVEMGSPEDALAAFNSLQSYEFEGRVINVKYARPKKEKTPPPVGRNPITFKLFVANLSYETRAKDLREFFDSGTSKVVSADVVFRENPRRPAGYGFVAFKSKKEATEALSEFQGKTLMGRPIRVAPGRRFVQPVEESAGSENTSFESSVNEEAEVNKAD
ncbi:28 kDa ribonucleoprotein, chloroplastic [Trifolium pratense]|uniref:28 kDa ribonucleoprotein, chloroplastic n=1 Tax=Trifolium pratense TaxID=57577 RepID=UPI001E692591|nr:28 kDa ribonucleoprotein, chloroplastic [Trifolium pratense]